MGWHGSCGFMSFWWLWWVAGLTIFFFIGRYLFRSYGDSRLQGSKGDTPAQVLKKRYAAGEIDREEYLKTLADLER